MRFHHQIAVFLIAGICAGCSSSSDTVREKLDPETVVTVTMASAPVIFYRDNSAHAAHSRDFVNVGPVRINSMGRNRYFLWLGVWSTIPSSPPTHQRDGFESVTFFADGEPLQLTIAGWDGSVIGVSESTYVSPVASAATAYYEVTIDQIRLIAEARDLRILTSGPLQSGFELWDNQQSAINSLREFVNYAGY